MRELWIEIKKSMPPKLIKALVEVAGSHGTVILADDICVSSLKTSGICVASREGGDISIIDEAELDSIESVPRPCCVRLEIKDRRDEEKALKAAQKGVEFIAIRCSNWKIIPLENLIAKVHSATKLLAEVSNSAEAKVALEILELGVDGIIIKTSNIDEVKWALQALETVDKEVSDESQIQLSLAKILSCTPLSIGTRVCIDTCDIMLPGEGMLIGCSSSGLFLVQAEVQINPYVEPRPFRVNAGPISLYILGPNNQTCYLSELRAGDETLIVDREGRSRKAIIGRVKIERRPLLLVEAEIEKERLKIIVQNAETIRLVTKDSSKSVTELKEGDEVLILHQQGGRHFGTLVREETAIER